MTDKTKTEWGKRIFASQKYLVNGARYYYNLTKFTRLSQSAADIYWNAEAIRSPVAICRRFERYPQTGRHD